MKYFTLFFLWLFLQSCTHFASLDSRSDRLALLDQYLAAQNYGKALALIAETRESNPQAMEIEKKRANVIKKLSTYEKLTIAKALKQERSNEWPAAKLSLKEALKKSGDSKTLKTAQQSMLLRFREKIGTIETEELIITGEWLQKKLPLLQDLQATEPDNLTIQWRYYRTQNDAKEIASQLLPIGEQMLEEKNLAMARRIIPLAAKLGPGPETTAAMNQLNKQLQAKTLKNRKNSKKASRKKDKIHIESFNKAMALGELAEARMHLAKLTPKIQKNIEVELMQDRLQNEINDYVQKEHSAANTFYRAGKHEQAISAWQNIIAIEPDNEPVKSKVERAKVIIDKLQSLRDRQAGESVIQNSY